MVITVSFYEFFIKGNKGNTIFFHGRRQSRGLVQRFIKGQSSRVHTCTAKKGIIISQGMSKKTSIP